MELQFHGQITSGPTLKFRNRRGRPDHTVVPAATTFVTRACSDEDSAEIDKGIRRWWLDRRLYQREAEARKDRNHARFQPDQFDQAAQHLLYLLRLDSHRTGPIYFADPYFSPYLDERDPTNSGLVQLYFDLFAQTVGRPFRILCAREVQPKSRPWWSHYPKSITNHVSVRTFVKRSLKKPSRTLSGFHDRYLITPEHEVIITNSLNGWRKTGVTFITHRYGEYRAEAEELWSMDLHSAAEPLWAEEIT